MTNSFPVAMRIRDVSTLPQELEPLKCSAKAALLAAIAGLCLAQSAEAQTIRRGGLFQRRYQAAGVTYYDRGYSNQAPVTYSTPTPTYTYTQPTVAPAAAPVVTQTAAPTTAAAPAKPRLRTINCLKEPRNLGSGCLRKGSGDMDIKSKAETTKVYG